MKLLYAGASPFARKVRVTAIEAGLADDVDQVEVAARVDQPNPAINAVNPLGKLPAMLTDDNRTLFDSRVITRYLDDLAGAGLYPGGDWDVLVLEALADGLMDSALSMVDERRFRSAEMVSEDWIDWQWSKAARALDSLETDWTGYLGQGLTAGHIATGCALGYLDLRHGDRNWRDGRPKLAAWYQGFAARPSMVQTLPTP